MHGIPQRYSFNLSASILPTISISPPNFLRVPSFLSKFLLRTLQQLSFCSCSLSFIPGFSACITCLATGMRVLGIG